MLQLPSAWSNYLDKNDRGASCLGQLAGLNDKKAMYQKAVETLGNPQATTLFLVTRPQKGALLEAQRASHELAALNIKNQQLIINGILNQPTDAVSQTIFKQQQADLQNMPVTLDQLLQVSNPIASIQRIGIS